MEFDLKIYEVALMQLYDSYEALLKKHKEDLFTKISILNEAREKVESGVLTVPNGDTGDE